VRLVRTFFQKDGTREEPLHLVCVLTPPGFAWCEVGADIVRIRFYSQAGFVGHLDSAVFHQWAVVKNELFPGYRWVALVEAPG
jgi:hypothetical protein